MVKQDEDTNEMWVESHSVRLSRCFLDRYLKFGKAERIHQNWRDGDQIQIVESTYAKVPIEFVLTTKGRVCYEAYNEEESSKE